MTETTEKRTFGGAQEGSGRPSKDGAKTSLFLADDVIALTKAAKTQLKKKSQTIVVEEAVREYCAKYGVELPRPEEPTEADV
jgi:RNA-splicing ligase RtcB